MLLDLRYYIIPFCLSISLHLYMLKSTKPLDQRLRPSIELKSSAYAPAINMLRPIAALATGVKKIKQKEQITKVGGVVQAAKSVGNISPEYPWEARLNKYEGKVIIKIALDKTGKLLDAKFIQKSRYDSLNLSAMKAIKEASYIAAKNMYGEDIASSTQLELDFVLD